MSIATMRTSPRDFCYAMHGVVSKASSGAWCSRPWNMYDPDSSAWWLVPSTEWPAYRHGKFFFHPGPDGQAAIDVGLYVEKGLGPSVKAAYSSRKGQRLFLAPDWAWHRLTRNFNAGLNGAIASIASSLATTPWARVGVGFIRDPASFDPYGPPIPKDRLRFTWDPARGAMIVLEPRSLNGVVPELRAVATMADLLGVCETTAERDWLWVDLFVGISFASSAEEHAWSDQQVWEAYLSRFSPWAVGLE